MHIYRKDGERDPAVWSDLSDLDSVNLHDVSTDIRHRSTTRDVEDVKTSAAPGGSDVNVVRSGHGNIDEMIDHYATQSTDPSRDAGTKQLTASEILQQYTQLTGRSVEDVVNEYTHQVETLRHQAAPGGYSRVLSQPVSTVQSSYSAHLYSPTAPGGTTGAAAFRTRAQRIQAIKDAASALKTRLNSEVQKMASHDLPPSATGGGEAAWVQPRPTDYSSRYDRITGTANDYNVFTSDLPGVTTQAQPGHRDDAHQNEAATKIQAAFRGHTVRQDARTESTHKPATRRQHRSQSSLDQPDFCAARRTFAPAMAPASHKHPDLVPMNPNLTWNKDIPDPDPFSVINILARRQLHRVKAEKLRREREDGHGRSSKDHNGHSRLATDHSSRSAVAADQPSQRLVSDRPSHADRHARSTHDGRSVLHSHSRSARTLDDITMSYKDDFTAASSASAPDGASRTAPSQSRKKSTHHSSPDKTITSEADDTLEATLTPSDGSDDDQVSGVQRSSGRSAKASAGADGVSSRSLVVSGRVMSHTADHSDVSEMSSLGEEDFLGDLPPTKMSPAALEHRHAVELHLLDSMEVSMRQLTDVERTRAVTLAQQETGRQQSHDHRVAEMQLRGHQEALEKERKLEAAQKRAAEAARSMAAVDRQAQDDVLSSLRGAASKLLQTQSEAARVTADAALQLTQGPPPYSVHPCWPPPPHPPLVNCWMVP
ncbi:hypothetical protein NP493_276g01026 [Ridgeia piscesae]|uniref:Uncharacterized protein n=1 Tax=Ridgeia piscesae TaxID=27915 RepID=A0AAD9UCC2_RIDPI|nr:hypothetical protein NP493_276g01026 [Ridgeia piscesae]